MRRFRFRLQPVLDQALAHERRIEIELGRLREALRRELQRLVALGEARSDRERSLRRAARGRLDLRRLEWECRDLERLLRAVADQEMLAAQLRDETERTSQALVRAMRRRQMLENLRDRRRDEHRREMTRLEIREVDDLVTPRFPKRHSALQAPTRQAPPALRQEV